MLSDIIFPVDFLKLYSDLFFIFLFFCKRVLEVKYFMMVISVIVSHVKLNVSD